MLDVTILASGSSGNSLLLRSGGCAVLVDAGLSARRLEALMTACGVRVEELTAVLLTHEHGDHARGLKALAAKHRTPVYATALTAESLRRTGVVADWNVFASGSTFGLGDFCVSAFSVPHDAADPVGFVIRSGGRGFAVLTDLGYATRQVIEAVRGVDGLLIETNHDEALLQQDKKRPWSVKQRILSRHGHLSNAAAADVVGQVATDALRHVVLGHLSRDCNSEELAIAEVSRRLSPTSQARVLCAPSDDTCPRVQISI